MTDPREALVETIRGALLSNAGHRLPPEQVVADAIRAAGWMPLGEPDPRDVAHIECDCVPDLGPSHCHLCSERRGSPTPWTTAHPAPATLPSEEDLARALAELNEDTDWEGGVESYLPDARAVLALFEKGEGRG